MLPPVGLQNSYDSVFVAEGQRSGFIPPVDPQPTKVRGLAVKDQCGAIVVVNPVIVAVLTAFKVPEAS
jgi:hypothetical protein